MATRCFRCPRDNDVPVRHSVVVGGRWTVVGNGRAFVVPSDSKKRLIHSSYKNNYKGSVVWALYKLSVVAIQFSSSSWEVLSVIRRKRKEKYLYEKNRNSVRHKQSHVNYPALECFITNTNTTVDRLSTSSALNSFLLI